MADTNVNEKIVNFEMLGYYDEKLKAKMATDDSTTLQSAKDYTDEKVGTVKVPEYSITKAETATEGYIASYNLTKDGVATGTTIDIPKDYLVKSAEIKEVAVADTPVQGYVVGDKYIDFTVNTVDGSGNESHLYLLITDLAKAYTAGAGVVISASNEVSIVTQDGTKDVGGISKEDYTAFKGAVTKSEANATAIEAINNTTTGILAQAKDYTNTEIGKTEEKVTANTDAIAAINNVDTGILASSKSYTDEKNTAMDNRVKALETTTSNVVTKADIDGLFA